MIFIVFGLSGSVYRFAHPLGSNARITAAHLWENTSVLLNIEKRCAASVPVVTHLRVAVTVAVAMVARFVSLTQALLVHHGIGDDIGASIGAGAGASVRVDVGVGVVVGAGGGLNAVGGTSVAGMCSRMQPCIAWASFSKCQH